MAKVEQKFMEPVREIILEKQSENRKPFYKFQTKIETLLLKRGIFYS